MPRRTQYVGSRLEVLAMITAAQTRHGQPPSVRELADGVNVGVATMHDYLGKMREEGLVEWERGRHRSLRCTTAGSRLL